MKNCMASLLLFISIFVFSQEPKGIYVDINGDSIVYNKNTNILEERNFSENLKEKYADEDFKYVDEHKAKDKKDLKESSFLKFFIFFMGKVFPILLAIFVIIIVLKVVLGLDLQFWKSTPKTRKDAKKLVYEDEDIHEVDLESLIKQSIENKDFRLSIRYYYLAVLKKLSTHQFIAYHKDKTNSEYLFEIENTAIRNQFSYLSYIYSYVWYGEFVIDDAHFKIAQNKYQSFLKSNF